MEFTFNTQIVDVSVALNALRMYREGDYRRAITHLIDVLDTEPNNWQARLMLGASYYKTGEYAAAQRVFRFLYEKCPEEELKRKAFEGSQAAGIKMTKPQDLPPEFGCYVDRKPVPKRASWLDEAPPVTQASAGSHPKFPTRWQNC